MTLKLNDPELQNVLVSWSKEDGWLFVTARRLTVHELYQVCKQEYDRRYELWTRLPKDYIRMKDFVDSIDDLKRKRFRQLVLGEEKKPRLGFSVLQ